VASKIAQAQADAVAAQLELDLDRGICPVCLSFVSMALEAADPRKISRELRGMTPDLWHDGLDKQALAAAAKACELGVPNAYAALADLQLHGGKSIVAGAIVLRLAAELSARTRRRMEAAMN
jgi:hypothetical protein